MKILKGISLFFLYPLTCFILGLWIGVRTEHFFFPGREQLPELILCEEEEGKESRQPSTMEKAEETENGGSEDAVFLQEVSVREETLYADTEYVLQEVDLLHGTEVETVWELPQQYIGMNRERFVSALKNYSDYPPLTEMERGFVNAEVISFARSRVVVRKSYQYVHPDEEFYLAVKDNEVVVYLQDKKTMYMNTGIMLEVLPEDIQRQIIQFLPVKGEEALYGFLESYSS